MPRGNRWDGKTPEERFWESVEIKGPDDCWPWTMGTYENGYGITRWENKTTGAHRVAFTLTKGPIPKGKSIMHTCDDRYAIGDASYRLCCNGAHLKTGTTQENIKDRDEKGRTASGERHGSRTRPLSRPRGEDHGMAWFTTDQVNDLRRRYPDGTTVPYTALAEEYGCHRQTIHNLLHDKFWKDQKGARPGSAVRHHHGADHGLAKLIDAKVVDARKRHLAGESVRSLASENEVSPQVMRDAIEGITWAHVPGAVAREDRPQTQFRQGADQPHAKLTDELVREGRRLLAGGMKIRSIARQLDRPYSLVYDAVKGKTWRHVTD